MNMQEQESRLTAGPYWGKADNSGAHHLLCYHALDVAAVGVALLRQSSSLQQLLRKALPDCTSEALESWFDFFLALHDSVSSPKLFKASVVDLMQLLRGRAPDPRQTRYAASRYARLAALEAEAGGTGD